MIKTHFYANMFFSVLIFLTCSNSFAQTINLNGVDVDIAKIPQNGHLAIENKSDLKSAALESPTPVLIFKSNNNQFFVKASRSVAEEQLKSSAPLGPTKNMIELFDSKGVVLWSKTTDLPILNCQIANDAKISHAIVYNWGEDVSYERIIVLDSGGIQVFSQDSVPCAVSDASKRIIYYIEQQSGERFLCCRDFYLSKSWEYPVCESAKIASVSNDGSHLLLASKLGIYSFDKVGTVIWTNPELIGRQFSLSDNGDYFVTHQRSGCIDLFSNLKGSYLRSITSLKIEDELVHPLNACFITNTNNLFLVISSFEKSEPYKTMLSVYDLEGNELLHYKVEGKCFNSILTCSLTQDNSIIVYYDGIEVAKLSVSLLRSKQK